MSVVALQNPSDGGIHMLLPPPGRGSPPSSPSNTPVSRRRASSRKSRPKPRSRKQSKPQLASADISTQESTTHGPGSSDSSDDNTSPDDGGTPLRTGDDLLDEEDDDESRSLTPNYRDRLTSTPDLHKSPCDLNSEMLEHPQTFPPYHLDHVSDIHTAHPQTTSTRNRSTLYSNSDDYHRFDSNETSDTDYQSRNPPNPPKGGNWASRRFESDLSTAPFSSETSDMDTSGNERGLFLNGNGQSPSPPTRTRAVVEEGGGGGGDREGRLETGKKGGDVNQHSASSGDEILSRKKHMKKPIPSSSNIPAKPPPPLTKKPPPVSGIGNRTQTHSSGSSASIPPKKPLHHTKSNPLAAHAIRSKPPQDARDKKPSTQLPARSLSTKNSLSTKPKPPITAKPKPSLPPKPQLANGGPSPGNKPTLVSKQATTVTKSRTHSIPGGQAASTGKILQAKPPSTMPKKPVIKGASEDRTVKPSSSTTFSSAVPPGKPSVAAKPRKLSSSSKPPLLLKSETQKAVPSPPISDSSKNPSSSDVTTSGQSQSPTNSPYPSPYIRKKPLPSNKTKFGILPKKFDQSAVQEHTTSNGGARRNSNVSNVASSSSKENVPVINGITTTPESGSVRGDQSLSSILEVSRSEQITFSPIPPPLPAHGVATTDNKQVGRTSPPGPPLPTRGPSLLANDSKRVGEASRDEVSSPDVSKPLASNSKSEGQTKQLKSAMSALSISSSSETTPPSPRPRTRQGPRRPPPSPPTLAAQSTGSEAQPTSNVLTNDGGRRGSTPSQISTDYAHSFSLKNDIGPPARMVPLSSRYEIEEDVKPSKNERYFGPHHSRETVEDIKYVTVHRAPLEQKTEAEGTAREDQQRTPTPQELAQDSGNAGSSRGSDSGEESGSISVTTSATTTNCLSQNRKFGSSRRVPPMPPRSAVSSTHTYATVKESGKKKLTRQTTDKSHSILTAKKPTSPKGLLENQEEEAEEEDPPPIPARLSIDEQANKEEVPPIPTRLIAGQVSSEESPPLPARLKKEKSPPLSSRCTDQATKEEVPRLPTRTFTNQSPEMNRGTPNPVPSTYEGMIYIGDKASQVQSLKPKEPIYDVIPDNFPKKKIVRPKRDYEEIILPEFEGDAPRLWVPPAKEEATPSREGTTSSKEGMDMTESSMPIDTRKDEISLIVSPKETISRLASTTAKITLEDLRENWGGLTDPAPRPMRIKHAKSFSSKRRQSLMYRRCNSDRLKLKVTTLDPSITDRGFSRSCSLDRLNDRMERSIRSSIHRATSSSEDEDEPALVSPTNSGLPKVPSNDHLYRVPKSMRRPAGPYIVPPDVEPLYQYINTAEFLRERDVGEGGSKSHDSGLEVGRKQNQLELARQLSQRKLWCELPEVIQSGVLETLNPEEKKLQEAMFEVISSEATYLRSLDVLIQHFMDDPGMNPYLPEGRRVIDKRQHHVIFSNVREVREVSSKFLEQLQKRQRESAIVKNISDIILDFAENSMDCYISYCTNQVYQVREMQDLIEGSVMFREYLRRLESDKCCQNLNMQSFLLLPMQRITRLPLLILAILNRTPLDHPDHDLVERTLRSVQKLVTACNDGARKMDRTEQLHEIHKKLDFGKLKPFPIVSVSRQLERRGTLIHLQVEQKLLGKNRIKRKPLYLFVFTDYIIVTKKKKDPKGDHMYRVKDYASRAVVEVEWLETHPGVSFPKFGEQNTIAKATYAVSAANAKHAFLMLFLDNASQKSEAYIFLAQNDTDKTRWMESLVTPDQQKDEEKIYQHWDCPQVQAVYDYQAQQPDELSLERGDVVKVFRKMGDGWYEGERLRDLQWGWFPSNFAIEIENAHTRARNLRQTHKLNRTTSNAQLMISQIS